MYKEVRDISLNGAISQVYTEMSGRHRAPHESIQIIKTSVVPRNEVVREKELKLRQGLSVVGVSHTVYWLSWIIMGIVFSVMTSLSLVISGFLCGFDYF